MAHIQRGTLDRSLTDAEEEEFREYARTTDPESLSRWALYHPVCRQEWLKRGIVPPPTIRFQGALQDLLEEYDVSLTFRDGEWIFRSTDSACGMGISVTIEQMLANLNAGPMTWR